MSAHALAKMSQVLVDRKVCYHVANAFSGIIWLISRQKFPKCPKHTFLAKCSEYSINFLLLSHVYAQHNSQHTHSHTGTVKHTQIGKKKHLLLTQHNVKLFQLLSCTLLLSFVYLFIYLFITIYLFIYLRYLYFSLIIYRKYPSMSKFVSFIMVNTLVKVSCQVD